MIAWLDTWEAARARAAETRKPIYLFLFSPT